MDPNTPGLHDPIVAGVTLASLTASQRRWVLWLLRPDPRWAHAPYPRGRGAGWSTAVRVAAALDPAGAVGPASREHRAELVRLLHAMVAGNEMAKEGTSVGSEEPGSTPPVVRPPYEPRKPGDIPWVLIWMLISIVFAVLAWAGSAGLRLWLS